LDKLLKGVIDANFPLKELRAKRSTEVVLFTADKVERGDVQSFTNVNDDCFKRICKERMTKKNHIEYEDREVAKSRLRRVE
jgi:hypothetical protein